jgi:hypothetical protein
LVAEPGLYGCALAGDDLVDPLLSDTLSGAGKELALLSNLPKHRMLMVATALSAALLTTTAASATGDPEHGVFSFPLV